MWIQRLHLRHAPGLPDGVALADVRPGLNVVVGPNASGKSTLARALRATLWPAAAQPGVIADATWRHGDAALEVTLHGDRATWTEPPPPLPDPGLSARYRLGLAELLRAGEADARLARAVARELAGGYDVDAALATFGDRKLPPRDKTRALTEAEAAVRRAEQEAVALADEEARLAAGASRRVAAQRAARLLPVVERLRDAAEARARRAALLALIEAAPADLDAVPEDAVAEVERLDAALAEATDDAADAARGLAEAEDALRRAELTGPPTPPAELQAWRDRVAALVDDAREAATLRRAADAAARAAPNAPAGAATATETLERAIAQVVEQRARADAAEALRRAWRAAAEDASEDDPEAVRRSAQDLRAWLRRSGEAQNPRPAFALLLAIMGAVNVWAADHLAVQGAFALAAGLAWLARRPTRRPRVDHPPPAWTAAAVEAHLDALDGRAARAAAADEARRRAHEAEDAAEHAAEALAAAAAGRQDAALDLGLDGEAGDLTVLEAAAQRGRARRLADAAAEAAARADAAEAAVDAGVDAVAAWLFPRGYPVTDAAGARAALDALGTRMTQAGHAAAVHADRRAAAERAEGRVEALRTRRAALFARAGVAPDDAEGLARRAAARAALDAQRAERARLDAQLTEARARRAPAVADLRAEGVADPEALDAAAVDALADELQARAAEAEGLARAEGALRARVAAASEGTRLADALAAVERAQAELETARAGALEDALARAWLEDARAGDDAADAPAVLRRAHDLFDRFTHGAYGLEVDPAGHFGARDRASGAQRPLEALSDATRVQLLLAARVAGIEEAEADGPSLPLVLDELLSTTDPDRFAAVADAVFALADAGRQVLYLTADPAEADQWVRASAASGRPPPSLHRLRGAAPATPRPSAPA